MTMTGRKESQAEIQETFQKAEQTGLKLAIKGRLIAIAILVLWLVFSRAGDTGLGMPALGYLVLGGVFAALGLAHYCIIASRWDRPWVKYAFLAVDIALLSALIALGPVDPRVELPQSFIFRFEIFPYYFLFVAVAGFSFSPWLVVWAGVIGSFSWLATYVYIYLAADNPIGWVDMPSGATTEQFLAIFLSPEFLPFFSRVQEIVILLVTTILLATVVHRARKTVYAHLEADAERRNVSDMFGRHVPKAIADMMISNKGALEPVERVATVMFVDIAGFTALTEKLGPSGITQVLNAYFEDATLVIGKHGGVITQFLGDAILAIFNVPVVDPEHARNGLAAARELVEQTSSKTYGGESLAVRIGINTGNLIAGNIGGDGRHNYTVYGDAVNLAARLETMNKTLGTQILMSGSTADQIPQSQLKKMGSVNIRGQSRQSAVFTVQDC